MDLVDLLSSPEVMTESILKQPQPPPTQLFEVHSTQSTAHLNRRKITPAVDTVSVDADGL
jgi:hypothetical protein